MTDTSKLPITRIDELITKLNEINTRLINLENSRRVIETGGDENQWYRAWSDGWIEQGGRLGDAYAPYANKIFTFLKPFSNLNYFAMVSSAHNGDLYYPPISTKTENSVTFVRTSNINGYGTWYACGY